GCPHYQPRRATSNIRRSRKICQGARPGRYRHLYARCCRCFGLHRMEFGSRPGELRTGSALPYLLLGVALLVALAFEFVNGFHDTANAVATVIYTHSLDPHIAVVWSGFWNFLGVVTSTGAVALGIVSLLPVELILQVGRSAA